MNDMSSTIIPKSDQINADDLLVGPITITIAQVEIRPGTEQPVSIRFEGDNGKPYKPCKSMCRVLVACWGPDASKYAGRSLTLYCDPRVTWGGVATGGIRISHMTDITGTQVMALTVTKGSKKPFTVKPLAVEKPKQPDGWTEFFGKLEARLAKTASLSDVEKVVATAMVQQAILAARNGEATRLNELLTEARARFNQDDGAPSSDAPGESDAPPIENDPTPTDAEDAEAA